MSLTVTTKSSLKEDLAKKFKEFKGVGTPTKYPNFQEIGVDVTAIIEEPAELKRLWSALETQSVDVVEEELVRALSKIDLVEPTPQCTYLKSGESFVVQKWYSCKTCEFAEGETCCARCALKCHADHKLTPFRVSACFCDCGGDSKRKTKCKCIPHKTVSLIVSSLQKNGFKEDVILQARYKSDKKQFPLYSCILVQSKVWYAQYLEQKVGEKIVQVDGFDFETVQTVIDHMNGQPVNRVEVDENMDRYIQILALAAHYQVESVLNPLCILLPNLTNLTQAKAILEVANTYELKNLQSATAEYMTLAKEGGITGSTWATFSSKIPREIQSRYVLSLSDLGSGNRTLVISPRSARPVKRSSMRKARGALEVKVDSKTGAATIQLEIGDKFLGLEWIEEKLKTITDELQTDDTEIKKLMKDHPEFAPESKMPILRWRSMNDYGYLILTRVSKIPYLIQLCSQVTIFNMKARSNPAHYPPYLPGPKGPGGTHRPVKRKPVIYLKSGSTKNVKVTLQLPEPNESFIELDPKPNGKPEINEEEQKELKEPSMITGKKVVWDVVTSSSGSLLLQKSLTESSSPSTSYPYLFWESAFDQDAESKEVLETEKKKSYMKISTSDKGVVCLHREHLHGWLKRTLELYGLNFIQTKDFLDYWIPIMSKNLYSLVRFLSLQEIETLVATLHIFPKPSQVLRVFMIFRQPSDKELIAFPPLPFKEEEKEPLKMKSVKKSQETTSSLLSAEDLTVVEWGGCNLEE